MKETLEEAAKNATKIYYLQGLKEAKRLQKLRKLKVKI